MKIKRNCFLALAVLVPFLLLAGCGDDKNELTETQKTALLGVTSVMTNNFIEVGKEGGYTYSYQDGGKDLTKATLIGNAGTTDGIIISTVKPELDGATGKVDLETAAYIKSGFFLLASGTLKYTVSSNTGDNDKPIYVSDENGKIAEGVADKEVASYVSTFNFTIELTPKNEDKEVSVRGTVKYDTNGGPLALGCSDFDPTDNQGTELEYESKGTGLYAAINNVGGFLICKKS